MEYSDTYLREVLPPEDPPLQFVPGDVQAEIQSRPREPEGEDRALVARSTRWTYAMFRELSLGQIFIETDFRWLLQRRAEYLTIGLYDPKTEQRGFGLALAAFGSKRPPFELIGYVDFPRLKHKFPLAVRQAAFEEHAPPHPTGATSTAWAVCNMSTGNGVLIAGHAVPGSRPGHKVAFANGQTGVLSRTAHPIIDAAFVIVPGMPLGTKPTTILKFPAAGHSAIVELQSGAVSRSVVAANSYGSATTRTFMVNFLTNTPCNPGDSGALVRSPAGEAMGIYCGSYTTPLAASGLAGFNQNFEQAVWALDITAHR